MLDPCFHFHQWIMSEEGTVYLLGMVLLFDNSLTLVCSLQVFTVGLKFTCVLKLLFYRVAQLPVRKAIDALVSVVN